MKKEINGENLPSTHEERERRQETRDLLEVLATRALKRHFDVHRSVDHHHHLYHHHSTLSPYHLTTQNYYPTT